MNMKQYLEIDSQFKKANGDLATHEEMYVGMVNAIGLDNLEPLMPVTINKLAVALEADQHLNSVPLKLWDECHADVRRHFHRLGITTVSMSQTVCTLKQAARMLVERDSQS